MQFNHYGGEAALLSAELANLRLPVDPPRVRHALVAHGVVEPDLTLDQARALVHWGALLGRCFGVRDVPAQCAVANRLLAAAASKPHISLHDGHPHLHYRAIEDDVVSRVRALTIAGLASVICFAGGHRLGRCGRTGCGQVYVDVSRNGRRRYCSVRCANTSAVARHRVRRAAAAGAARSSR